MKLIFGKNKKGEIYVEVDGKSFSTKDYIKMIKEIKNGEKIEAEFKESITEDERGSVGSMLNDINNIKKIKTNEEKENDEEVDSDDLPF